MDNQKEVVDMMMKFLKRATGDNATSDEIAIIPQVAKILLDYSESSISEK